MHTWRSAQRGNRVTANPARPQAPIAGIGACPVRPHQRRPKLREYPLYGVACVECGRPGLTFVPSLGVKHRSGWCRASTAESDPFRAASQAPQSPGWAA